MRFVSFLACAIGLLTSAMFTEIARADDPAAAAQAYSQGQAAEVGGQTTQAAELYEAAYRAAPHPVSLRAAVRMRLAADQKAQAAGLAERLLTLYADDAKSSEYAQQVLQDLKPGLLRLSLTCDTPCNVLIDGSVATLDASLSHTVYVLPGSTSVSVRFVTPAVESEAQAVEGAAGGEASLSFITPELPPEPETPAAGSQTGAAPAPPPPEPKWPGIPRIYTLSAIGIAVIAGGVSVWSGLDTSKAADEYDNTPESAAEDLKARKKYNEGLKLQQRTNILIGLAGSVAVVAGAMAIFTNWSNETPPSSVSLDVSTTGAVGSYTQSF